MSVYLSVQLHCHLLVMPALSRALVASCGVATPQNECEGIIAYAFMVMSLRLHWSTACRQVERLYTLVTLG